MTPVVVDASAGVEMLLRTANGLRLQARLPEDPSFWAPEHYFTEVGAVLPRLELHDHHPAVRIRQSLDVVLAQRIRRVSVRPLMMPAMAASSRVTDG